MLKKLKTSISKFIDFLRESKVELKKVTWPTKKETLEYAIIVLSITITVGIILWIFDSIFSFIIRKLI